MRSTALITVAEAMKRIKPCFVTNVIEIVEEKAAKAKEELGPDRYKEIISMMIKCA